MKNTPFDRIASDCMARKMPFPEELAKQYVRILQKLDESWGMASAVVYLDELIMPARIDRQGFSPAVVHELISLKELHEFTYPVKSPQVWDPYYDLNRQRFEARQRPGDPGENPSADEGATGKAPARPRPSVYKSWFVTPGTRNFRNSPVGGLYPARGHNGRTTQSTRDNALDGSVMEMLEDAEDMLDLRRMQSATALYEQAIVRAPRYSAYPYLRLLEIYYDMDYRGDFERVSREFSRHFGLDPVRWVLVKVEFWAQLDNAAAILLKAATG
jgi:hypothetical protein